MQEDIDCVHGSTDETSDMSSKNRVKHNAVKSQSSTCIFRKDQENHVLSMSLDMHVLVLSVCFFDPLRTIMFLTMFVKKVVQKI